MQESKFTQRSDSTDSDARWRAPVVTNNSKRVTGNCFDTSYVRFQSHSGTDEKNVARSRFVKKAQARPTSKKLIMWNKSKLTPLGEATLEI